MNFHKLLVLMAVGQLAGCNPSGSQTSEPDIGNENFANGDTQVALPTPALAPATIDPSVRKQICRETIAELNGHPTSIIKVVSDTDDIVRVKYSRPDDGKVWTNECKLDGDRVIWRAVDAFGKGSGTGRWRDGPYDEKITYEVKAGRPSVHIEY